MCVLVLSFEFSYRMFLLFFLVVAQNFCCAWLVFVCQYVLRYIHLNINKMCSWSLVSADALNSKHHAVPKKKLLTTTNYVVLLIKLVQQTKNKEKKQEQQNIVLTIQFNCHPHLFERKKGDVEIEYITTTSTRKAHFLKIQ